MRSLIIAEHLSRLQPPWDIQFILNKHTSYSSTCPFTTHLLDDSPTKAGGKVNRIIEQEKPDIVVFDASGRASQLKAAKAVGSTVLFISQHVKKRQRGMRLNRARHTDYHLVVQPDYVIGDISTWQKVKLKLFNCTRPKTIGSIFTPPDPESTDTLLSSLKLTEGQYILINAGSGGHVVDGSLATDIYFSAAQDIAQKSAHKVVFIQGSNYPARDLENNPENHQLMVLKDLPNQDFINLLSKSKLSVLAGGSTLLQAIELKIPTVTSPISKDQPNRIKQCEKHKLTIGCKTEKSDLLKTTIQLLKKPATLERGLAEVSNQSGLKSIENIIALEIKNRN